MEAIAFNAMGHKEYKKILPTINCTVTDIHHEVSYFCDSVLCVVAQKGSAVSSMVTALPCMLCRNCCCAAAMLDLILERRNHAQGFDHFGEVFNHKIYFFLRGIARKRKAD